MVSLKGKKIGIIGLGYIGLPLAVEFAKYFQVIGFDIDEFRISEINSGKDRTREVDIRDLLNCLKLNNEDSFKNGLFCTSNSNDLKDINIYIVTVPTPIDRYNRPNLQPLLIASKLVGEVLKKQDVIIFESTVYPGCTEEECVPILERESGLKFNIDFYCGYSPERINPGDRLHTLTNTIKVTSGSTFEVAMLVDELYRTIIKVGTYLAPSIKVAEASKSIENAQRDVNISFINELALIFDKLGIDTNEVLDAAATKYNFLRYKPGLVGGHCISVDPYYLAHRAKAAGYHPQVILSGRRVNDMLASFITNKVIKLMLKNGLNIRNTKALILGITFKEDCPDIRNTKVVEIFRELNEFGMNVDIFDPLADMSLVEKVYNITLLKELDEDADYKAVIIAVAHQSFKSLNYKKFKENGAVIFDVKGILDRNLIDGRL